MNKFRARLRHRVASEGLGDYFYKGEAVVPKLVRCPWWGGLVILLQELSLQTHTTSGGNSLATLRVRRMFSSHYSKFSFSFRV